MRFRNRASLFLVAIIAASAVGQSAFGAAAVSITPITLQTSTDINLSTTGAADWIRWSSNASQISAPSNFDHSSTGGGKISTWTEITGSGLTPFDNSAAGNNNRTFSWVNGTPNPVGTTTLGYVWEDTGADSTGHGFTFTVAADTNTYDLRFFVANHFTIAKLTATLLSPSSTPLASQTDTSWSASTVNPSAVETGYYDVVFTGAEALDTLNVNFQVGTNFGAANNASGNGYVGISAAALAIVPEPTLAATVFLVLMPLIRSRRP